MVYLILYQQLLQQLLQRHLSLLQTIILHIQLRLLPATRAQVLELQHYTPPSGLSYGAIAAIVIGVLFGLAITALATWLLVRKSRRRSRVTQVTPPQTPIYSPSPPSSPLPTPPPLTESGNDRMSSLEDSWVSYGDRVRSPTPQPAVAEIRSFTRAWQKPRAYTVSRGRMTEVHGSEDSESPPSPDDDTSPISPLSRSSSVQADRRVVSPVSLVSRFSTMSNRTDQSRERAESQRKAF